LVNVSDFAGNRVPAAPGNTPSPIVIQYFLDSIQARTHLLQYLRENTKILSNFLLKFGGMLNKISVFDYADRRLAIAALDESRFVCQSSDCHLLKLKARSIAMWTKWHFSPRVFSNENDPNLWTGSRSVL
jgi:hypothetical protein